MHFYSGNIPKGEILNEMKKIFPIFILICAVIIIIHIMKDDSSTGTPVNIVTYESSGESGDESMESESEITETVPEKSRVEPVAEGCVILDVPYYSQDAYPTGCELVSSTMLLEYYGYSVTVEDLIYGEYISTIDFYYSVEGVLYGGNPYKEFIGSPYDAGSYGCYSGAIMNMLNNYLMYTDYAPTELTGTSLPELCSQYIDYGIPVLVWASIDMLETYTNFANTWIIEDTGESFTWLSNEHCLVLVGYDDFNYYFNDPMRGKAYSYSKDICEQRYKELGMQSIIIQQVGENNYYESYNIEPSDTNINDYHGY